MKKTVVLLLMGGLVLPCSAQLNYRVLADTTVAAREDLYSQYDGVCSDFRTISSPNHSIFLSYLTEWPRSAGQIKSFIVKNQDNTKFQAYEGYPFIGPYSTNGKDLEKWENSYFALWLGYMRAPSPFIRFLDQNFKERLTIKKENSAIQKYATTDGGFLIVSGDSLFKLDNHLSPNWKISLGINTPFGGTYIKEAPDYYLITVSGSTTSVILLNKSGIILSSFQRPENISDRGAPLQDSPYNSYYKEDGLVFFNSNQITKVNLKGEEQWRIPCNSFTLTPQNEFLVRSFQGHTSYEYSPYGSYVEDKAQFAKYNSKGQKLWETPFLEEFANTTFQPTSTGGFVTIANTSNKLLVKIYDVNGRKIGETPAFSKSLDQFLFYADDSFIAIPSASEGLLRKFNNQGKQEWFYPRDRDTLQFKFSYPQIYKKYPNGSLLVHYKTYYNSNYINTYPGFQNDNDPRVALIKADGQVIFDEAIKAKSFFETNEKYLLFATDKNLYRLDENGTIIQKTAINYVATSFSYDDDGQLLVIQRRQDENNKRKFRYSLAKLAPNDQPLWKIELPSDKEANAFTYYQNAHPNGKNGYDLVVYKVLEGIPNPDDTPFLKKDRISFLTITRPCYENLNATLKSPALLLCESQKLALTSNTDSLNFLSYQWQRDGQTLATTRQSTFDATAAGTYRVIVRDSVCGTSFTSAEVKIQPRAALQPLITTTGSTNFCAGADVATLTVSAPKSELSYQWYRNGQSLGSAFQSSLRVTEAGRYQLFARDSVCKANALSPEMVVNVRPLPEATVTPEINGAVYAPFKAKLKANEGADMTYQWFKESVEIAGETRSIYEAGESGSYSVRVNKDGCSRTSSALSITILQPLGVEVMGVEDVKVYPNPTNGNFQLALPQHWQKAEIELIDILGRQLPLRRDNDHFQAEATAGAFWLRIRMGEKEIKKRLIIIR